MLALLCNAAILPQAITELVGPSEAVLQSQQRALRMLLCFIRLRCPPWASGPRLGGLIDTII